MKRGAQRAECKEGHALVGENLFIDRGRRRCRICARERCRRQRAAKGERVRAGIVGNFQHGTLTAYQFHRCRCHECRAANTEKMRKQRAAREGRQPTEIPHGLGGYNNYKCRCDVCCQASAEYLRAYLKRRADRGDVPHGTSSGYRFWGCRCRPCKDATNVSGKNRNAKTRDGAYRHGFQWTGPELEIVARKDLTAVQIAQRLGRTRAAVHTQRWLLTKGDPMKNIVAGLPKEKS